MSAMSNMEIDANEALDLYVQYMEYDGDDIGNEERRWQFIEAAVEVLEKLTGRKVEDEIDG